MPFRFMSQSRAPAHKKVSNIRRLTPSTVIGRGRPAQEAPEEPGEEDESSRSATIAIQNQPPLMATRCSSPVGPFGSVPRASITGTRIAGDEEGHYQDSGQGRVQGPTSRCRILSEAPRHPEAGDGQDGENGQDRKHGQQL